MTALDFLTTPALVEQAWAYFRDVQTKDIKYTPLIGPNDKPGHRAQSRQNGEILARIAEDLLRPDALQNIPGSAGHSISDGEEVSSRAYS